MSDRSKSITHADVRDRFDDQAVLCPLLDGVADERDRGEEATWENPFLDEVDLTLVCMRSAIMMWIDNRSRSRTLLEAGLGNCDDLETGSAFGVEHPVEHGEVAGNEILAGRHQPSRFTPRFRRTHPTASSISIDTTRSNWPFQLSGKLEDQQSHSLGGSLGPDALAVVHEPDSNTPGISCGLDPFFSQHLLLRRKRDCVDRTRRQSDGLASPYQRRSRRLSIRNECLLRWRSCPIPIQSPKLGDSA